MDTIIYYVETLTLEFEPFFENVNLANTFWTVSARAFIFLMNIPSDEIVLLVPNLLTLIFLIKFHIAHEHILWQDLWPWPSLELVIIGGICVSQTHLVLKSHCWKSEIRNPCSPPTSKRQGRYRIKRINFPVRQTPSVYNESVLRYWISDRP